MTHSVFRILTIGALVGTGAGFVACSSSASKNANDSGPKNPSDTSQSVAGGGGGGVALTAAGATFPEPIYIK